MQDKKSGLGSLISTGLLIAVHSSYSLSSLLDTIFCLPEPKAAKNTSFEEINPYFLFYVNAASKNFTPFCL